MCLPMYTALIGNKDLPTKISDNSDTTISARPLQWRQSSLGLLKYMQSKHGISLPHFPANFELTDQERHHIDARLATPKKVKSPVIATEQKVQASDEKHQPTEQSSKDKQQDPTTEVTKLANDPVPHESNQSQEMLQESDAAARPPSSGVILPGPLTPLKVFHQLCLAILWYFLMPKHV